MEERKITIEYDATAEDALNIALRLLNEFGAKFENNGEGTITYWAEPYSVYTISDLKKAFIKGVICGIHDAPKELEDRSVYWYNVTFDKFFKQYYK